MNKNGHLFTSESVTEGHPDKIADQISDAVLDAVFTEDPNGRVTCETLVTTGLIIIAGEITTKTYVDIPAVARGVVKGIGYTDANCGFDYETCGVMTSIDEQSPDISQGVSEGTGLHKEHGAGDQGLMFGYACNETRELMPLPISLAHKLTKRLSDIRRDGSLPHLRPDGKSQVTIRYENGRPLNVDTVVVSTQHHPDIGYEELREDIIKHVIRPVLPIDLVDENKITYHINPTGRFVVGGPMVDTSGTGVVPDSRLTEAVRKVFDLRPAAIIEELDLRRPIYQKTAAYGHFGREEPEFTWEKTNRIEELKKVI